MSFSDFIYAFLRKSLLAIISSLILSCGFRVAQFVTFFSDEMDWHRVLTFDLLKDIAILDTVIPAIICFCLASVFIALRFFKFPAKLLLFIHSSLLILFLFLQFSCHVFQNLYYAFYQLGISDHFFFELNHGFWMSYPLITDVFKTSSFVILGILTFTLAMLLMYFFRKETRRKKSLTKYSFVSNSILVIFFLGIFSFYLFEVNSIVGDKNPNRLTQSSSGDLFFYLYDKLTSRKARYEKLPHRSFQDYLGVPVKGRQKENIVGLLKRSTSRKGEELTKRRNIFFIKNYSPIKNSGVKLFGHAQNDDLNIRSLMEGLPRLNFSSRNREHKSIVDFNSEIALNSTALIYSENRFSYFKDLFESFGFSVVKKLSSLNSLNGAIRDAKGFTVVFADISNWKGLVKTGSSWPSDWKEQFDKAYDEVTKSFLKVQQEMGESLYWYDFSYPVYSPMVYTPKKSKKRFQGSFSSNHPYILEVNSVQLIDMFVYYLENQNVDFDYLSLGNIYKNRKNKKLIVWPYSGNQNNESTVYSEMTEYLLGN